MSFRFDSSSNDGHQGHFVRRQMVPHFDVNQGVSFIVERLIIWMKSTVFSIYTGKIKYIFVCFLFDILRKHVHPLFLQVYAFESNDIVQDLLGITGEFFPIVVDR
uniref:Uncharacterized protein n=1 Tax=Cacopsylla melanoneura TaxID=428564 RepID=A0A8D8W5R2_9HEMI